MAVYMKPDYMQQCFDLSIFEIYQPTAEQIESGTVCNPENMLPQKTQEFKDYFMSAGTQYSCQPMGIQEMAGRTTCDEPGIRFELFNDLGCGQKEETVDFQEGCQPMPLEMHKQEGLWWNIREAGWASTGGRPGSDAAPATSSTTVTSPEVADAMADINARLEQAIQQEMEQATADGATATSSRPEDDNQNVRNERVERVGDMVDEAAQMFIEEEGMEEWQDITRQVEDGIEQGMRAYEEAAGAFEGNDGRSSSASTLAAAFTASALTVAAIQF